MKDNIDETVQDRWAETRSGAWAARGFHYQHLFSTLILVRQWAGLAPTGNLVPEGEEDCVVELPKRDVWIQIKSRQTGRFGLSEVQTIFKELRRKEAAVTGRNTKLFAVGLEQPCSGVPEHRMEDLLDGDSERVVICSTPQTEIVRLLTKGLEVAEIIAEGLANDLYTLVAESAAANASLPYEKRRRISTTEIERRIYERLEAADPSAIDLALVSRALEPIDFVTPISEPGFYQGVKVNPGHVAAGLVMKRPVETRYIVDTLKNRRHLLITGPSGAGKSALTWLASNSLSAEMRLFQISSKSGVSDADAIVRFVRARRPGKVSPIGLIFDEVGGTNSGLWNALIGELRSLPHVYFLGSARNEDLALVANRSDTEFFETRLDDELAQSVWAKLTQQGQTNWSHWREPFEQSKGLMLEYVHLLTQGKRLAAVISEQVNQRRNEGRHDELAIIRGTAVLCSYGGEVEAKRLFKLLDLPLGRASAALQRLIDEHLVRESRPGVLGGLHTLRSRALSDASHDDAYLRNDSFWSSLLSATPETLPRIIHAVLTECQEMNEAETLRELSKTLAVSDDAEVWSAILTGLGLGTLERCVASFITILEHHRIPRADWLLTLMFAGPNLDFPELSDTKHWKRLRNAVSAFRALTKPDLRADCLGLLPPGTRAPNCTTARQANKLLSCLVPIAAGKPVHGFVPNVTVDDETNIRDVATLLSTAYAIHPEVAQNLASAFGGEQKLFDWFRRDTPWVTLPVIESYGDHGRTVSAHWFLIAEEYQHDPHTTVCSLCETLIGLSPTSNVAAADAVDATGRPIAVNEFKPFSKCIPRENLLAKAWVAWNVAFRQILLARAVDSVTEYAMRMSALVRRTEKVFRSFSENWIKGRPTSNPDAIRAAINEIVGEVNALAYATPATPASLMTTPANDSGLNDKLGGLLTKVLSNLVPRMANIQAEANARAPATFAGMLSNDAKSQLASQIWRAAPAPPLEELKALAERLDDIACILHEMAHTNVTVTKLARVAKKGILARAVHSAAGHCRSVAGQRLRLRLRRLEKALRARGCAVKCWTRPVDEKRYSVYWPAEEIAVVVEVTNLETELAHFDYYLSVGQRQLANDWRFRIVPALDGHLIPELALIPSSPVPLPDLNFRTEWQGHVGLPFLSSENSEAFDAAVAACIQLSAITNCRDMANLHSEEEEVLSRAANSFKRNWQIVKAFGDTTGLDEFNYALVYLDESRNQVLKELEAIRCGQTVDVSFCTRFSPTIAGEQDDKANEFIGLRVLLRQAEYRVTQDEARIREERD